MATLGEKRQYPEFERSRAIITYHAPTKSFDRLFKGSFSIFLTATVIVDSILSAEESLLEVKEMVRQKLGLPPDATIRLEQVRGDITIDLEDRMQFQCRKCLPTYFLLL